MIFSAAELHATIYSRQDISIYGKTMAPGDTKRSRPSVRLFPPVFIVARPPETLGSPEVEHKQAV